MHYIQANTGGRLHPAHEPSVSPLNRGYLYGDAIYEVWRTYNGVLFAWDEHWRRLENSARALHMHPGLERADVLAEIRRTVSAFRERSPEARELYIRFQIARGSGPIGLDVALADRCEYVILVQPCPEIPAGQAQAGVRLSVGRDLRRNPAQSLNPAWKTGNYLNNLLCLREAKARGADDVVILNLEGNVAEASVSNIAFVRKGRMLTPPLSDGILGGITRGLLLGGIAKSAGVDAVEASVGPSELASMDECFLMSTTKDIVPVGTIDGVTFKLGEATVARRLKDAFARFAADYAASHRSLAV